MNQEEWKQLKSLLAIVRTLDDQLLKLGYRCMVNKTIMQNLEVDEHEQTDMFINPQCVNLQTGEARQVEVFKSVIMYSDDGFILLKQKSLSFDLATINLQDLYEKVTE